MHNKKSANLHDSPDHKYTAINGMDMLFSQNIDF